MIQPMSQPKLKQLAKLLKEWEEQFKLDHTRPYHDATDDAQPLYADMINTIRHHVEGEINEREK